MNTQITKTQEVDGISKDITNAMGGELWRQAIGLVNC